MSTGNDTRIPVSTSMVGFITTWACRLALWSATWWLQVLAGGVVLGVAPASFVLYERVRAGVITDDAGSFRSAWRRWREVFLGAQTRYLGPILTVPVLLFYLRMMRGTPLAISIAIVLVVFVCWLIHVPAVRARTADLPPAQLWLLTARVMAGVPVPFALSSLAALAVLVGLLVSVPGALVVAVPSVPALLATLAVARVPDAAPPGADPSA